MSHFGSGAFFLVTPNHSIGPFYFRKIRVSLFPGSQSPRIGPRDTSATSFSQALEACYESPPAFHSELAAERLRWEGRWSASEHMAVPFSLAIFFIAAYPSGEKVS